MKKNTMEKTAFSRAYAAWFSEYERERRASGLRRGATIPDFPAPPKNPDDIQMALDTIGQTKALKVLGVHRSTLARWLSGASVIPRASWLLLALWSQGRLPGMSADWQDFRFQGDTLALVGTRIAYTAREIAGWQYQTAHAQALARRIAELEKQNAHLLRVGEFGAANDPIALIG
jgi:hypothetical protein